MEFTKEHLINKNYDWSTQPRHNHNVISSSPDRRLFDRLNGNQILYLINFFGHSVGNITIDDGQRIEDLITKELPAELKSEKAVFNWLIEKYLYYWN
jgi:hypothetical protein